ncbi:MAG: D-glycero-alpha-D-manno-heptose-1,7-bisphosphate 7-phosphatase [Planctomycetota bacterium]|jgi:D-glycero-D-manno-heptose 1,7-bisphosphate phosphatase
MNMSNKAIFLDRDDTLIEDPGYINHPDQVKLLDDVAEALIELKRMGYKLIVVSNQSAVAHGIVTEKVLGEIHNRLKELLAEKGAYLDKIYYCPYHPDGAIPKYRKESDWRKPNPGMLLAAADKMGVDLSQSWSIGDSARDVEAGLQAGCKTILINRSSHYKQSEPSLLLAGINPDYKSVNIKEAVNIIKKYHRSSGKPADQTSSAPTGQIQPLLQAVEQPHSSESTEPAPAPPEQDAAGKRTEQLLSGILEQLKSMQRANMFGEFSIMRLMAGIMQIIVLFCLLITIWFLMSPNRQDNLVLFALGFAMLFQLMSLTFYIMQGRR